MKVKIPKDKCCKNEASYEVVYETANGKKETLIFCKEHFHSNPIFSKHIKEIRDL